MLLYLLLYKTNMEIIMLSRTKPPTAVPTKKLVLRNSLRDDLASTPRDDTLLPTPDRVGDCTLVNNTTLDDAVVSDSRVANE